MRRLLLALPLTGLIACTPVVTPVAPAGPTTHTLTGTLALNDRTSNGCHASEGSKDIHSGAQVTVKNEASVIVGSGVLGQNVDIPATDTGSPCIYHFTIPDVGAAKFYTVEVANRGALTYSAADLEKAGWKVALTLGN
jgi:hypothetical protein